MIILLNTVLAFLIGWWIVVTAIYLKQKKKLKQEERKLNEKWMKIQEEFDQKINDMDKEFEERSKERLKQFEGRQQSNHQFNYWRGVGSTDSEFDNENN